MLSESIRRLTNFSTYVNSQRELNATPSNTARIMCSRVVMSDWLKKPPRSVWFSTGVRSPYSHGVKISLPLPAGVRSAI